MREIAPGVLALGPWGRTQTNAYLVHSEAGWTLVDAGWERDARRIQAAVRSVAGRRGRPVAIVLTHDHADHAGAALDLARAWGCPVLMHPAEMPFATGDFAVIDRSPAPLDRFVVLPVMRAMGPRRREEILARQSLAAVARPFDPDAPLPELPGWDVVATPGHTPGHVSYLRTADRVLISGDALLTLQVNHVGGLLLGREGLSGPPWYTTWDRDDALRSVATLAALEPAVLAPGHGWPCDGPHTAERVRAFAARLPPS